MGAVVGVRKELGGWRKSPQCWSQRDGDGGVRTVPGHPEGWAVLEGGCRAMDGVKGCREGGFACGYSPGRQHGGGCLRHGQGWAAHPTGHRHGKARLCSPRG